MKHFARQKPCLINSSGQYQGNHSSNSCSTEVEFRKNDGVAGRSAGRGAAGAFGGTGDGDAATATAVADMSVKLRETATKVGNEPRGSTSGCSRGTSRRRTGRHRERLGDTRYVR